MTDTTLCSYCEKPTFGNHRLITMAGAISVLCGVCDDKWQDRYQQDNGWDAYAGADESELRYAAGDR